VQSASGSLVSWSVNEFAHLRRTPSWRASRSGASRAPQSLGSPDGLRQQPDHALRSWEPLFPGIVHPSGFRPPGEGRSGWSSTPRRTRDRCGSGWKARPGPTLPGSGSPSRRGDAAPDTPNLRHLATSEIKWQGIEYLLASPSDFWDKDIRNNPRDWGLTPVAEKNDYRLYRID